MVINSVKELENLFETHTCDAKIDENSFSKTRYIDQDTFHNMISYVLNFEPYIGIAKRCSMTTLNVLRSIKTNRFYIGFVNLGGHGATWEVRPVGLTQVKNHQYLENMFANYAQELDWGIDLNEGYEI